MKTYANLNYTIKLNRCFEFSWSGNKLFAVWFVF